MVFRMVVVCAVVAYGSIWFQQQDDARKARDTELDALVADALRDPPPAEPAVALARDTPTELSAPEGLATAGPVASLEGGVRALALGARGCLQSWWMLDPRLRGVDLHLAIEPGGLSGARVSAHAEAPAAAAACLAAAAWGLDWSGLPEAPLDLDYSLDFDPDAAPDG